MFPCQDIREEQSQKTIAYMQVLQYWVEKANPLTPGRPCLLERCVLELRKAMESYVSFSDDAILDGAASLEGSLEDLTGVTIPGDALPASTSTSIKEEPAEEPAPMEVTTEEAAPTMKYCTLPGQLPLQNKFPWTLVNQSGDTAARALGEGELGIKGWKNVYKPWSCMPCHHPSFLNWYKRMHCPLASWGW